MYFYVLHILAMLAWLWQAVTCLISAILNKVSVKFCVFFIPPFVYTLNALWANLPWIIFEINRDPWAIFPWSKCLPRESAPPSEWQTEMRKIFWRKNLPCSHLSSLSTEITVVRYRKEFKTRCKQDVLLLCQRVRYFHVSDLSETVYNDHL